MVQVKSNSTERAIAEQYYDLIVSSGVLAEQVGMKEGKPHRRHPEIVVYASEQFPELLYRETCVTNDTAHRDRIDRVVTRDGEDAISIAHHDVFTLTHESKSCLLQRAHGVKVIDSRNLWQRYTATSISRTSWPRISSSTAAKYSRMAS